MLLRRHSTDSMVPVRATATPSTAILQPRQTASCAAPLTVLLPLPPHQDPEPRAGVRKPQSSLVVKEGARTEKKKNKLTPPVFLAATVVAVVPVATYAPPPFPP